MSNTTTPTPKDEYEGCIEATPILFCAHEWEYSEQSEPHNGRDYYTCRACEKTIGTDPDTGELIVLPQEPTRFVSLAIENYTDNSKE